MDTFLITMISFAWLSASFIISPGPGNALFAANGARFGFRSTIPFLIGFDFANFIMLLIYGFGFALFLKAYPQAYHFMKIAGALYIFYLAFKLITAKAELKQSDAKPMSLREGFIVCFLNPKIHSMMAILFSQFLQPDLSLGTQVMIMTAIFVPISILCHMVWIIGGAVIFSKLKSERAIRNQNYLFGGMIALIGVYILVS